MIQSLLCFHPFRANRLAVPGAIAKDRTGWAAANRPSFTIATGAAATGVATGRAIRIASGADPLETCVGAAMATHILIETARSCAAGQHEWWGARSPVADRSVGANAMPIDTDLLGTT